MYKADSANWCTFQLFYFITTKDCLSHRKVHGVSWSRVHGIFHVVFCSENKKWNSPFLSESEKCAIGCKCRDVMTYVIVFFFPQKHSPFLLFPHPHSKLLFLTNNWSFAKVYGYGARFFLFLCGTMRSGSFDFARTFLCVIWFPVDSLCCDVSM